MRIAFVGLPLAALLLARDGHEIVWAGICRADAIGTRRLRRLLGDRAKLVPDLAKSAAAIRAAKPDLLVSWFWTKNVPESVRSIAPALGVHPSLLPRHRGPDPFFWAIDRGDTETGVTAHYLDAAYDTGAVLGQKRLAIDPTWNSWTLAKKLDRPSLALLRETVAAFARAAPARPASSMQDEALATEAPAPDEEVLEIRWPDPADAIVRRVRAASPWPGAFTEIGGAVVTLTRVRATTNVPRNLAPGEAYVRADGIAVVRAGAPEEGVELLAGRVDDDDETSLDAAALAALVSRGVDPLA